MPEYNRQVTLYIGGKSLSERICIAWPYSVSDCVFFLLVLIYHLIIILCRSEIFCAVLLFDGKVNII